VQTLEFAQDDAVKQLQRTVSIAVAEEGPHTLVAEATDWAGGTQPLLFPIAFTLDTAPPAVTIDPGVLTSADTWQPQSGMLRFNGAASDNVGLVAVQVRVDGGEFVDATFADGTWQTALYVPDPEGRTLNVTVRATDRAGRTTEITQPIATDLSAPDAPDTAITGGPADPDSASFAGFTFVGSAGTAVFECKLDDGLYQPCASPQQYGDLSKGSHTFRVRAVDSRGYVDLSPAIYTWTVVAGQADVTLTGKPANPTTERSASFTFAGDETAAVFECSLDGSPFTPCTSPQVYNGLGNGEHIFLVRARNGANQAGAAERYTWTVRNAPLAAGDQRVTVAMNQAKEIVLAATGNGALLYTVETPPAHGVLTGLAPNLRYAPDTNFQGVDRFTFSASDGEGDVATATVTITVVETEFSQTIYLPRIMRGGSAGTNVPASESVEKLYLSAVQK
jgi:hypothetical protein